IWWSEEIVTEYDFWTQDLEDKVASLNLAIPADVDSLNVYLHECIWDPINQLFFPYQHQPASYVQSGTLKGLVFCMDVDAGISVESLKWITDAEMQRAHLTELYPFINWTVDIEFLDISEDSAWSSLFWMYATIEPDGTTVADGLAMFNAIYDVMKPIYTEDDGNINVFGVIFIKQQMEMQAYGRTYTGLGGNGQTVIWKSWERYYRPDGVTPKDGISVVQLHETMHAIGFHHSWQHERYSSDFSWSPMGYFAIHNGTSTFDKNWVQGTYLDQMEALLWDELLHRPQTLYDRPETDLAEQRAAEAFNTAREFYNQMDWMAAYNALLDAKDWIRRVYSSIMDTTPPTINAWGTIPEDIGTQDFLYWADVTDDFSGIENVTLFTQVDDGPIHKYLCSNTSTNWSVVVEPLDHESSLRLWIRAYDWGMNVAEGGVVQFTSNYLTELLIPLAAAVGVASVVIIAGIFVMKRKR
ncbi:MAG: hypothetical protein ACFFDM_11855, partial [Candidatus Thorarchaeota archaeon]